MNHSRSGGLAAIIAAGFLLVFAPPASAHTSHVSHVETCNDNGTTTTVVTFDNDYNLAADAAYRWGVEPAGTAHMAAKTGPANTTASLPAHPVGTIAYHVTWADNYRQPTAGDSTLTILPLADCHPALTTTTTGPAATTTTEAATTSTLAATTTTTVKAAVMPVTTTTTPTAVLGTTRTLPRTGFPIVFYTAIGLLCLLLGGAALYLRRIEAE